MGGGGQKSAKNMYVRVARSKKIKMAKIRHKQFQKGQIFYKKIF